MRVMTMWVSKEGPYTGQKAIEMFRRAAALEPLEVAPIIRMGDCYRRLGQKSQARDIYHRVAHESAAAALRLELLDRKTDPDYNPFLGY